MTVKQVKKKQKHKSKGSVRTITKQVKADSFFNFFDPPAVPDDPNAEVDEDTQVKYQFTNIENRALSDAVNGLSKIQSILLQFGFFQKIIAVTVLDRA